MSIDSPFANCKHEVPLNQCPDCWVDMEEELQERTHSVQLSHTPGPWSIEENLEGGNTPDICGPTGEDFLCRLYGGQYEVVNANTRLISKAPDMYEALTELLRDWTFQMSLYEETANAKAVRELLEEIDGTK